MAHIYDNIAFTCTFNRNGKPCASQFLACVGFIPSNAGAVTVAAIRAAAICDDCKREYLRNTANSRVQSLTAAMDAVDLYDWKQKQKRQPQTITVGGLLKTKKEAAAEAVAAALRRNAEKFAHRTNRDHQAAQLLTVARTSHRERAAA